MSLFADICNDSYAYDDDIAFDQQSETWTVLPGFTVGLDKPLAGITTEDMALAIVRALRQAFDNGSESAGWS